MIKTHPLLIIFQTTAALQILVADPSKRCSLADVCAHPWFLEKLPPGTLEGNARYGDPANARETLQQPATTMAITASPTFTPVETPAPTSSTMPAASIPGT